MTKESICDCIEFTRKELAKVLSQVQRIENIHGEPVPEDILDRAFGTGVAYNLGRAQSIAQDCAIRISILLDELARCLPPSKD